MKSSFGYLKGMNDTLAAYRWFWQNCTEKEGRKHLVGMLACLFGSIAFQALAPSMGGLIISGVLIKDTEVVWRGAISVFLVSVIIKIIESWQEKRRELVFSLNWIVADLRITGLFFGKSVAQHVGEGRKLSSSSIEKGKWALFKLQDIALYTGFQLSFSFVIFMVAIVWYDWVSGLLMAVNTAIYLTCSLYLNYKTSEVCTPIDEAFRKIGRKRNERMVGFERVKTCAHEKLETKQLTDELSIPVMAQCKHWLWYIDVSTLRSVCNSLCVAVILGWSALRVKNGVAGWEDVGVLFPLWAWISRVTDNLWQFGDMELRANKEAPSAKSAIEALSIPPSLVDKPDAFVLDHTVPHRVVFENVGHTYPKRSNAAIDAFPALVNVNLTIEPREKVALLGPSGAGKTTIMKLGILQDRPTSGKIMIDGMDLSDVAGSTYLRGVGYAAQHGTVFDGTIRDNLVYSLDEDGRKEMTDEKLVELMRHVRIDFATLDTVVGERGLKLSGGQSQRLLLAAAIVKRPWFLVIDEGTASLDSRTEKQVQIGLQAVLSGDTSALIITHRLNTVRRLCTKFAVLRTAAEVLPGESQIEAIAGSFEELYQISPTFRELADEQGVAIAVPAAA